MSEANYFNKIITNHAVDLTDDEIAVLSVTLGRIMSGGYTDYKYWRPTIGADGNCTWELDRNIVDKPNPAKVVGTDGRTPVFSADPTNAHLVWAYADAVETSGWSDIPYALSGQKGDPGAKGNKGDPGVAGENGRTPELQVNEDTELEWKYTDEAETEWRSLGLYASGNSGFSPTVSAEVIPTSEDTRGGYRLTFQYGPEGSQTQEVEIFNGTNGEGAQFTVSQGTGIEVTRNGNDFDVALNSNTQEALAQVPVLAAASADWNKVLQKFDTSAWDAASGRFVTSAGLQNDTWYLFTTSGWKPSDSVMTTVVTDATLSGTGWNSSPLGLAQNVREITFSAGYADNAKYAEKVTDGTYEYDLFPLINAFALNNSSYLTTIQHDSTLSGTGHNTSQLGIAGNVNIPSFSAGYAAKAGSAVSAYQALYYYDVNEAKTYRIDSQINGLWEQIGEIYVEPAGVWRNTPIYADYALSAYLGNNSASGFNAIVDELHGKLDTSAANYLPLSGGTIHGETVISGAQNDFDNNFLKFVRDGNNGSARIGLASSEGMIAIKASKQNGNDTCQINIQHNSNTNEMIQVQKNGNGVGYLIPADIRNSESGLTNDGVLHIILDS